VTWTIFWLWTLFVGVTLIIGHKRAGSAYVRRRRVEATEGQMQQIYFVLGCGICILAVMGLAVTVMRR
jgi:hypothetical protein